MPDENKLAKLREIQYEIPVTCGLCQYGRFPILAEWGTCMIAKYDHLRQNNPDGGREVSIIRNGKCPKATLALHKVPALGSHAEFIKE